MAPEQNQHSELRERVALCREQIEESPFSHTTAAGWYADDVESLLEQYGVLEAAHAENLEDRDALDHELGDLKEQLEALERVAPMGRESAMEMVQRRRADALQEQLETLRGVLMAFYRPVSRRVLRNTDGCGYTLYLAEGSLTALSPVDGSETALEAAAVWKMGPGDPWTFRAEPGVVFSISPGGGYALESSPASASGGQGSPESGDFGSLVPGSRTSGDVAGTPAVPEAEDSSPAKERS